jgi:predicted RNase H-like nuclease (RuvC/YqgF family)
MSSNPNHRTRGCCSKLTDARAVEEEAHCECKVARDVLVNELVQVRERVKSLVNDVAVLKGKLSTTKRKIVWSGAKCEKLKNKIETLKATNKSVDAKASEVQTCR